MGTRVEGMRRPKPTQRQTANLDLLDNLILVFLVGILSGIGLAFVVRANHAIVPEVLRGATSAALGLLTSLSSRHSLRAHTGALRAAAAVAAQAIGLIILGWISGDQAGMALPFVARAAPNWGGLLQLSLGAISALLAVRAWPARAAEASIAAPAGVSIAAAPRPPRTSDPTATSSWARWRPLRKGTAGSRRQPSRLVAPRGAASPAAIWARLSSWTRALRPGELLARRRRRVQLFGAQEHRCPYCLELVDGHDPQGVVVCRVCHTRHHADCWAITGECQVPHYHK